MKTSVFRSPLFLVPLVAGLLLVTFLVPSLVKNLSQFRFYAPSNSNVMVRVFDEAKVGPSESGLYAEVVVSGASATGCQATLTIHRGGQNLKIVNQILFPVDERDDDPCDAGAVATWLDELAWRIPEEYRAIVRELARIVDSQSGVPPAAPPFHP